MKALSASQHFNIYTRNMYGRHEVSIKTSEYYKDS